MNCCCGTKWKENTSQEGWIITKGYIEQVKNLHELGKKKYEKSILCLNVSKIHVGAGGIYRAVGEDGASKCQDSHIFWWATLFWKVYIFLKTVSHGILPKRHANNCLVKWFFFYFFVNNNDCLGKRNVAVHAKVSWSNNFTALIYRSA